MIDIQKIYDVIHYVESKVKEFNGYRIIECNLFAYEPEEKIIYVAKEEDDLEEEGNAFLENYLKNEFNITIPKDKMFIFSVLHEIGHFMTLKAIDMDDYWNEIKKLEGDDFLSYRKIKAEYIADKWAINFINDNKDILCI
jgi:hypothetical protein